MKEFEFNRCIVPLRDRMFRYAQSLLLCANEAEDVVHDVLEHLWRDRDKLSGCRSTDAFVMTAVRNRCFDQLRRRQAMRLRDDAASGWMERTTAEAAIRWDARDLVRRAMGQLPERQREVLHLKDIEGYPTEEIGQLVGCDSAQVRMILSRARNGLRTIVKQLMDDERTQRTD